MPPVSWEGQSHKQLKEHTANTVRSVSAQREEGPGNDSGVCGHGFRGPLMSVLGWQELPPKLPHAGGYRGMGEGCPCNTWERTSVNSSVKTRLAQDAKQSCLLQRQIHLY